MNSLKKLAGQTAIYGISSIVGRGLNYLLVPFYTAIFVASEYGIVTELYAYVAFLNIIYVYGRQLIFVLPLPPEADPPLAEKQVLQVSKPIIIF